jgi:hypothetical protein
VTLPAQLCLGHDVALPLLTQPLIHHRLELTVLLRWSSVHRPERYVLRVGRGAADARFDPGWGSPARLQSLIFNAR